MRSKRNERWRDSPPTCDERPSLLSALQLGLGLRLLLHQGAVVLGAAGEAAPPPAVVVSVGEALQAKGLPSSFGAALRKHLLGDAEPLGELTEAQAALITKAVAAYDEGSFADAALAAETAFAALAAAPPSTRCEALARQAQLLWGASLLRSQGAAGARPHFRWALERDPLLIADRERFPPPVQQLFERERSIVGAEPTGILEVSAVGGGTGGLQVDGLPRGVLPRELPLPPHVAKLWVEATPSHGWAHSATLTADHPFSLKIDLLLESVLTAPEGDLRIDLPPVLSKRARIIHAVTEAAGATDLVLVAQVKSADHKVGLSATRFDAQGTELARVAFAAEGADYAEVAQSLLAGPHQTPVAVAATPVAEKSGFPVWPVVLGAAGAVAVAAVLTAVFWPHNFELTLTPSAGR